VAKKQDISDIIRDAINGQRPKKKLLPKKVNPPAYNVQPIRPRKGEKSDEGNQDLRDVPYDMRPMPNRSKPKPKRNKPKAAPKRGAKY